MHLRERRPSFGVQPRSPRVAKLADDLDPMFASPSPHLILLNRDRVLLPVLGRVPVVRHRPHQRRSVRIRDFNFPPMIHVKVLSHLSKSWPANPTFATPTRQLREHPHMPQAAKSHLSPRFPRLCHTMRNQPTNPNKKFSPTATPSTRIKVHKPRTTPNQSSTSSSHSPRKPQQAPHPHRQPNAPADSDQNKLPPQNHPAERSTPPSSQPTPADPPLSPPPSHKTTEQSAPHSPPPTAEQNHVALQPIAPSSSNEDRK